VQSVMRGDRYKIVLDLTTDAMPRRAADEARGRS